MRESIQIGLDIQLTSSAAVVGTSWPKLVGG